MIANTTDFTTFTDAEVWLDYGSSTIDTTAIFDEASGSVWSHRFFSISHLSTRNYLPSSQLLAPLYQV